MIKYTKDYIAKLLDKYMDGTSTLEEEDILADYFHRGNVPEEWEDYRQLFSEIEAMKPKRQKRRWAVWGVALQQSQVCFMLQYRLSKLACNLTAQI